MGAEDDKKGDDPSTVDELRVELRRIAALDDDEQFIAHLVKLIHGVGVDIPLIVGGNISIAEHTFLSRSLDGKWVISNSVTDQVVPLNDRLLAATVQNDGTVTVIKDASIVVLKVGAGIGYVLPDARNAYIWVPSWQY